MFVLLRQVDGALSQTLPLALAITLWGVGHTAIGRDTPWTQAGAACGGARVTRPRASGVSAKGTRRASCVLHSLLLAVPGADP